MRKIFLALCLCFVLVSNQARSYHSSIHAQLQFKNLTIDNGLSNNWVNAIAQDSIGYMWFATSNGLNRFDGYNVTQYKHYSNDSLSILSNNVKAVFGDSKKNLWVGDLVGLSLYNHQFDNFKEFKHPALDAPIVNVEDIIEDNHGKVWIAARSGVYIYDLNTNELQMYRNKTDDPVQFPSFRFFEMFVDSKNNIWFTSFDAGLFKFDQNSQQLTVYKHDPKIKTSISDQRIECVYEDRKGRIWIGTYNNGLNLFDSKTGSFRKIVPDPSYEYATRVRAIWENHDGKLFVGTRGGLYLMDTETEQFIHYAHRYHAFSQLTQNSILCHFIDRSGVLWLGTYAGGVNYADFNRKNIFFYRSKNKDRRFLFDPDVNCITEDISSDLWIGGNVGISKLDKSTQLFTYFTHDPTNINSISYNDIKALTSDKKGNVWIGTNNGGLDCYNVFSKIMRHFKHDPNDTNTLTSNKIYALYLDSYGKLWIIASNDKFNARKINVLSENHRRFTHFPYDVCLGIAESKNGDLWFGAYNGIWHFERETNNFTLIQNDSLVGSVNTLLEDSDGQLWIGHNRGLVRYNPETEEFILFNETCTFPFYDVYGILEDDHKNLWISTSNGIVKFINAVQSVSNPQFQELRMVDGIQGKQFNQNAYYKNQTGDMYFGGINGFNVFHPDEIKKNPYKPNVEITNFRLFNKKVVIGKEYNGRILLPTSLSSIETLVLTHKEYVFSLEFSAFHYAHPEHNQHAYKLEGFDKDWNYTDGTSRLATYTNLAIGDYTFMVKAANYDGVWNEKPVILSITVLPAWWRTSWAYLTYIMVAGILLLSIWRFQLNRRALKHELILEHQHAEKLQELNRMKSRFFSNITHEFRSPLTLIMGPMKQLLSGEIKGNYHEIIKMMLRNSERLYQLVNQLLELSKLEAGRVPLHTQKMDIVSFVKDIVMSYASLAECRKINLQFESGDLINDNQQSDLYADPDKLLKIITNLLSNALKFTPENGHVRVSVKENLMDHYGKEEIKSGPVHGYLQRLIPGSFNTIDTASQPDDPDSKKLNKHGYIEICVKDDGQGIRVEDLNKVFNRFYQEIDSQNVANKSFGIGLALAKELVELHSGTIHVESVYEQGSSFIVRLPLGTNHLLPEEISPESYNESQSTIIALEEMDDSMSDNISFSETSKTGKKNFPILLIVDDNSDIRKFVTDHLKMEYQIVTAKDGQEGLNKATSQIPDLIVSDVSMPQMNGIELCEKIKTDERTSHIPFILLTVRSSEESKCEGLEIGADDYITKPFEIKELKARIRNLIEQRRKLQEKFNKKIGLKPSEITTNSVDELFLNKALSSVENNISEPAFGVEELAIELSLHRVHLYRKIRAITGQSATEFIRSVRLNRAAQLIKQKHGNISQIAYEVGFHYPSYFSNCFYKQFGVYPSEYVKE